MKVCHLTSTHGNKDQRILIKECVSLAKHGYDVCQVAQGEDAEYKGVKLIGTGEKRKESWYRLLIRPKNVYKIALKQNADIYQIHDMELLPYAVKLKRQGKKVIFDYHEDFASRFEDSDVFHLPHFLMAWLGGIYKAYEKSAIAKLDGMISVTPHTCDRLRKSNSNTIMITNYPIIEDGNSWAAPVKYNCSSNIVCFAGQISCVQYSLDTVVNAVQEIKNAEFVFYGNERRKGDIEYLLSIDKCNKVKYGGLLPFEEVPNVLSNSRVAIVTPAYSKDSCNRVGSLGNNKIFEAMLRGIPVIFTNYELWNEINEKYHFGIPVEHGDYQSMVDAIKFVFDNPEEAQKMGEQGRKAVMQKFNWTIQEKKLLDFYLKLK